MHPSLEIEEILRYILEFLYGDPSGQNRRSLVNLAITCRNFLRPALEILWFDLPSLSPLVMCLPEDAWEKRNDEMSGRPKVFLRRALFAADWNILQRYVPFVKSCSHDNPDPWGSRLADVDARVFHALRICKPNTPVFPNLRVLAWNPHNFSQPGLNLFLSTNLLEFSSVKACPAMLVALKQKCTRLRKLNIHTDYPLDPDFIPSLSDLVVHLPSLETVHSPVPLTDDAIVHLSMLPNLKELKIPNDAVDFLRAHEKNASHPMFSTLVVFDTYAYDLSSVVSLLTMCRPRKLRVLILETESSQARNAERLFIALASCCSHDAFQSICFFIRDLSNHNPFIHPRQNPVTLPPFPAHVLRHLLVFRKLWNLVVDLPFDLDDNVVGQMASSWPGMLQIVVQFPVTEDHPKITLRGLVAIAKHWHQLRRVTLVLKVSARDLASLQRDIEGLQKNNQIGQIVLADAWIDNDVNPAHLSTFLQTLFPKLFYINVDSRRQMPVWNQITSHLQSGRR